MINILSGLKDLFDIIPNFPEPKLTEYIKPRAINANILNQQLEKGIKANWVEVGVLIQNAMKNEKLNETK